MNHRDQKPDRRRAYPGLYERLIPIGLAFIVLAIVVVLVIAIAVALGLGPAS